MNVDQNLNEFMDCLEVGISAVTWPPSGPYDPRWVFVNEARCRLTGYTREEILAKSPTSTTSRESRAQLETLHKQIVATGQFTCESVLLHKSNMPIPVIMHMKVVENGEKQILMVEHHDIRPFKKAEARLLRAEENAGEMLSLIEKEKRQLAENITDNLELVIFPLLDQLKISASNAQKEILALLRGRIKRVATGMGIAPHTGRLGANLTRRQIMICEMIRDGLSSKDIARALECAPSTISNHRNTIRKKLGLSEKSINLQTFLNTSSGETEIPAPSTWSKQTHRD